MNFKAMNMKKGLKRFWIVGSVFWFFYATNYFAYLNSPMVPWTLLAAAGIVGLWWALLYVGFWVARGFVDDDDNKAGF